MIDAMNQLEAALRPEIKKIKFLEKWGIKEFKFSNHYLQNKNLVSIITVNF